MAYPANTSAPADRRREEERRRARTGLPARPAAGAALAALLGLCLAAVAHAAPVAVRHDLSVRLHPADGSLDAVDVVAVRPAGERAATLLLAPDASVKSVSVKGREMPFAFREGALRVVLPPGTATREECSLRIAYRASFRDSVSAGPRNPGYAIRGTIEERGTFLADEAGWYPRLPGSRPTFRVTVEGPAGYEAVTTGALVHRETSGGRSRSEWNAQEPLEGLSLAAGPYRIRERSDGAIRLYTYFHAETDSLSGTYLAAVARYIDLYQGLFGPYPFRKFAVVENFLPTGYGFPSFTLLGSAVLRLPFIVHTSLGHEVAHSWWGNGVLVDFSRGNWSEGLTTYVADYLYKERSSAEEAREYRRKILRDYSTLVPRGRGFPLSRFTERDSPLAGAIGYGKGAMVFHMARRLAGDDAFWKGLRDVVREKMFHEASWDDFAHAFRKETGIDFAPFFRQWVERSGAPVIALADVRAARARTGWRVRGTIVQEAPCYDLKVPVRLAAAGGSTDTVVHLSGKSAPFSLSSPSRPLKLVLDPAVDLFRRLGPSEIPPAVNSIRGSTDLLVVTARGLPDDVRKSSLALLSALEKETAAVVREEDTPPSRLAGRDVLFLGFPAGKGYLPALPRGFAVSAVGFTADGIRFRSRGDALFAVLRHPSDRTRVAALFVPLSARAAEAAIPKIPHYGSYGYLAFSSGVDRLKGRWEVSSSPTVWEFPPRRAGRRSPVRVPEARDQVIVDHADGLHEGVADRGADEAKPPLPEVPGKGAGPGVR